MLMVKKRRTIVASFGAAALVAGVLAGGVAVASQDSPTQPTVESGTPAVTGQSEPQPTSKGRVQKEGKGCKITYPDREVYFDPVPGGEVDCDKVQPE
jgi:ABC-type phosphate transport system substrate-binding protein